MNQHKIYGEMPKQKSAKYKKYIYIYTTINNNNIKKQQQQ